ncbi:MAG: hypothetical protein CL763_06480 [Chloroflexi bacterium]|nr:hypothetical protein [Chloroflexota bacterium]
MKYINSEVVDLLLGIITKLISLGFLIFNKSVPLRYKILPFLGMLYLIFPRDFIIDMSFFGLVDDAVVFFILASLFISKSSSYLRNKAKNPDNSIIITDYEINDDNENDD